MPDFVIASIVILSIYIVVKVANNYEDDNDRT
jgi:hypothetical protein